MGETELGRLDLARRGRPGGPTKAHLYSIERGLACLDVRAYRDSGSISRRANPGVPLVDDGKDVTEAGE